MFEAKLGQASILKRIVEAVKDLVTDAPFDCTEGAMCLQAMDASHVALVSLRLDVGLFESYRCDRTVHMGLSLANMSKALKCANNDDTCHIFHEEKDNVTFVFEDPKKNKKQDVTLKLMDIDTEHLGIPDQKYSVQIEMPATEFQKTCKDLAMFSDSLSITATKSGVTFKGAGDTGGNTVTYSNDNGEDGDDENRVEITVNEPVNLNFSIKYMNQFTKATSLSNRVRISMCDNVPIVVEYGIEENGYLRFYLAPKIDDEAENMD